MKKIVTAILTLLFLQLCQTTLAQQKKISGTVLSSDDTPVAAATVLLKGERAGTQTDANGHFTINASPGNILVISAVGHSSREIKVGNSSTISITLQREQGELGEVVITALGIKKQEKSLGYATTQLDAKELMKNKNTNIVNSLAGKVPGVNVT